MSINILKKDKTPVQSTPALVYLDGVLLIPVIFDATSGAMTGTGDYEWDANSGMPRFVRTPSEGARITLLRGSVLEVYTYEGGDASGYTATHEATVHLTETTSPVVAKTPPVANPPPPTPPPPQVKPFEVEMDDPPPPPQNEMSKEDIAILKLIQDDGKRMQLINKSAEVLVAVIEGRLPATKVPMVERVREHILNSGMEFDSLSVVQGQRYVQIGSLFEQAMGMI